MTFLYPIYLYGLALMAIPVIIHYFNFQRAKRVAFTNVAFLKTVKDTTNARNRLKHLLAMLARMLFIAALSIAFAQPILPAFDHGGASGNHVSVYFDNSFSMQNEQDGHRLLDMGMHYTEQIGASFPKNYKFQLVSNEMEGNLSYFFENDRLSDKASAVSFCNIGRNFEQVYARQLEALRLASGAEGNHIFWISDFQKGHLPDLAKFSPDSSQRLYLVPITPNAEYNLSIDSVWLETPFVKVQENQTIKALISNHSGQLAENKVVKLFIDGNQASSATVNVPARGKKQYFFNFSISEPGAKKCQLTIEDYPITFDNDYFFALQVAPKIKIVSVSATEDTYIPDVYSNEAFFEVQHFMEGRLDYAALQQADMIVLSGLGQLPAGLMSAIRQAYDKGVTLAIFPAYAQSAPDISALASVSIKQLPVIPLIDNVNKYAFELQAPDPKAPFFEGVFERIAPNMAMPHTAPALEWSGTGETLLRYKSGAPFLSLFKNGAKQMYLFAGPLDAKYSNLPKHAMFVPILYKMALSSKKTLGGLAYSFAQQQASLTLPQEQYGEIFKLQKDGVAMVPAQRVTDGQLLLEIPKGSVEAGCYEVRNNKTNELVGVLAFNYAHAESEMLYYTGAELKDAFKNMPYVQVFEGVAPEQFANTFKSQHAGVPLWRYVLLLALTFLLAETLIIRFWKG